VEDVVDLYRLRTIVELEAAGSVAGDERRLAPAHNALAVMESIAADAPWGTFRDADLAFHQALVDGLESERISRVHASVMSELRLCFLHLKPELERPEIITRQHREIVEALAAGDADHGVALLRDHLDRGCADIRRSAAG
jgi:DNA-binding GntR family transcriptional regulator